MPRFNANLSMLYPEVDFLQRFSAAAQDGFKAVEFLFPYGYEKTQLADLLAENHLQMILHNLPGGKWEAGERGVATFPERRGEFQDGVGEAIAYAKALNCPQLNCIVGKTSPQVPGEKARQTLVENLRFAARAFEAEGLRLLVEPLNSQDVPGFFLVHSQDAIDLFDEVGEKNIWLQYDVYHMQIMEGNLCHTLKKHLPRIAHLQVADNPGRHEPGSGEIHYPNLFEFIDQVGYEGWIGCEYMPKASTRAGLTWLKPWL